MLTVRFFSLIREAVATEELQLPWTETLTSVAAVKQTLIESHGPAWEEALMHPNVLHAVNQVVVNPDHPLVDGDELGFFPPMTGG